MDFFIPVWLVVALVGTIGIGVVPLFWAAWHFVKRFKK